MTTWYLDTSAALKLLVRERESEALIGSITESRPRLLASQLLETELRRAAQRIPALTHGHVVGLLDRTDLYAASPALFTQAGLLPGTNLRSFDALHLATAIEAEADAVVTYDVRMAASAFDLGVPVLQPGSE